MTTRYHINPQTLSPGICKAVQNCPFGEDEDHYPTRNAAQKTIDSLWEDDKILSLFPDLGHSCNFHSVCKRPECVDRTYTEVISKLEETDLWEEAKVRVSALVEEYFEIYGNALLGRTRATFVDEENNVVYKIPLTEEGISSNSNEVYQSELYSSGKDVIPIAKSEFIDEDGLIMKMERVTPIFDRWNNDFPEWTNYVDCKQVGLTKDGVLVAFDL